jgi:hypothetical protein
MSKKTTKLVREGNYTADVPVELIEDDTAWSPYLSIDDVRKLDAVRLALRRGDVAEASRYGRVSETTPAEEPRQTLSPWLRATVEDAKALDFEAPIAGLTAADSQELSDLFQSALPPITEEIEVPETAATRIFGMLLVVTGMHFASERRNEPFVARAVLADGRRTPIPEDFRGAPLEVLAFMAERTASPVLRARLSDVSWLLDRKRGKLGALALSSYIEIIQKVDEGRLKFRFNEESGVLTYNVRDLLRRALQIGRSIGWEKSETLQARAIATGLRKRAIQQGAPIPVLWFSELDLDFGLSDPAEVAQDIDGLTQALPAADSQIVVDLWRLAARAFHTAKKKDEAQRAQSEAAERLVLEAGKAPSAMLASHFLIDAIAELHGIPGKKERRIALRHQLIDLQARIPEEMSPFSHQMDLRELAEHVEKQIKPLSLLEKLLTFAALATSPKPEELVEQAAKTIREHPLASLFGATHHDREGKVVHRSDGAGFGEDSYGPAIRRQIAQDESIRRHLIAFEIDVARRTIMEEHYLSDDVFRALLEYCAFVPRDHLATFARALSRFFQGDFPSSLYILTPLLENSLRYILKAYGHDVTIFDDATQTQQDRTISSLFEQMRQELDTIFTRAITTDIERVFLDRPGPYLRHSLAHGLLHDGDPYGPDAIYGCWLIIRLCLLPLFPYKDRIKIPPEYA